MATRKAGRPTKLCVDRQTTIADEPTKSVPFQSDCRVHEQTRGHPRARRQDAGRTEVRLHGRGLTTAGQGLNVDTGQLAALESGNSNPAACPGDDHTEACRGAVEPVGLPIRRDQACRQVLAHAGRSLGQAHQASGVAVLGPIKSSAEPGSSSPATDTLQSSPAIAAAASRSLAATWLSDKVP